jgi:ubiquinone/menaquinone biosynthesis C-methylase UbiE
MCSFGGFDWSDTEGEPGIGNPRLKLKSALRRCSIELHKLLPQAKIIGMDLPNDMLKIARKNAHEAGMSNFDTR